MVPKRITLQDKDFDIFIDAIKIQEAIAEMSLRMNEELKDKKPLFIGVLNGVFLFAADLVKRLKIDCEVTFVRVSSYDGSSSTGKVNQHIGLNNNIKDRTIVVLEDIIDTGITINSILHQLGKMEPTEIRVATLFFKPEAYKEGHDIDYIGLNIPNDFIVGYGLDYNGLGRNLNGVYKMVK